MGKKNSLLIFSYLVGYVILIVHAYYVTRIGFVDGETSLNFLLLLFCPIGPALLILCSIDLIKKRRSNAYAVAGAVAIYGTILVTAKYY